MRIRTLLRGLTVLVLLSVCGMPAAAQAATVTNQSLAVPLYAQPGKSSMWEDIRTPGSASVPFVVANPNNGPGVKVDAAYVDALAKNQAANIRTLGYTQVNYQQRPFRETLNDIDTWYRNYPAIRGVFIDSIKEGGPAEACYVSALYSHVKNTHPNDLVVLGPGTHLSSVYEPYGDIFLNAMTDYSTYQSWRSQYSGFEDKTDYQNRFWHVVYGVPAESYSAAFDATRQNNAGWVYLTDKGGTTPFTATPSFWQNESADIGALPPSTIPNRGKTSLPRGCISLNASADTAIDTTKAKATSLRSAITVSNTSSIYDSEPTTSLQLISLPRGVEVTNLAGAGWTCNVAAKNCSLGATVAASSSVARITAELAAGCEYGGGSATIRLTNYAGNRWDAQLPIRPPFGCDAGTPAKKINADTSGQVITLTTQSTETTPEITPLGKVASPAVVQPKKELNSGMSFAKLVVIVGMVCVVLALAGLGAWWFYKRQRYHIDL